MDFDTLLSSMIDIVPPTPAEKETRRVNDLIMNHRDEVIEILKEKYPEEFI